MSDVWEFYSDGSYDTKSKTAGYAVVVRSPRGQTQTYSDSIGNEQYEDGDALGALEAELFAFSMAAELAQGKKEPVVFFVDNKTILDLINKPSKKVPSRIHGSMHVAKIIAELALIGDPEVLHCNDRNSEWMRMAHNEANCVRKRGEPSVTYLKEQRSKRLVRAYREVSLEELMEAVLSNYDTQTQSRIMENLDGWIDDRAIALCRRSGFNGYALPGEEFTEDLILHRRNQSLVGLFNLIACQLDADRKHEDALKEISYLMAQDWSEDKIESIKPECIDRLSGDDLSKFMRRCFGQTGRANSQ